MAIGAVPLTPLYPVLANPDARFQRFGLNESKLEGKPMLDLMTSEVRPTPPQQMVSRPTVPHRQTMEVPAAKPEPAVAEPRAAVSAPQEWTSGYTAKAGSISETGTGAKPGSYVNLKA